MVLFLLQAATATAVVPPANSGLSLGEWIALTTVGLGLCGSIYRLGVNTADTRNLKSAVTKELADMSAKLDRIAAHIDTSQVQRVEDARWRGDIESRVGTVERDLTDVRESVHKARNVASEARAIAEDRRTGPNDRRQS